MPAGTPAAVVSQLHSAFKRASQTAGFQQRARNEGLVLTLDSPEETARFVRAEEARWRKVIKDQSITME